MDELRVNFLYLTLEAQKYRMVDNRKIDDLFKEYYSPLCNYAAKFIENDALAEDLVQTFFIQLWEKKSIQDIKKMDRFLIRGVKNKCIDYLRTKKVSTPINIDEINQIQSFEYGEVKEEDIEPLLHYYAAKLPPKAREIFLLSRKSGLKYKDIAAELNISIKTVENQMGHSLRKMREILKAHDFFSLLPFL